MIRIRFDSAIVGTFVPPVHCTAAPLMLMLAAVDDRLREQVCDGGTGPTRIDASCSVDDSTPRFCNPGSRRERCSIASQCQPERSSTPRAVVAQIFQRTGASGCDAFDYRFMIEREAGNKHSGYRRDGKSDLASGVTRPWTETTQQDFKTFAGGSPKRPQASES
jgi:hypothetical protein